MCRPVALPSLTDDGGLMEGCVSVERSFISDNIVLYYVAYYCFRVIFIHFVPCCTLVVLNALLGISSSHSFLVHLHLHSMTFYT